MSPSAQSKQIWHDSSGLITLKISRVRKAFQNGTYTRIYMSWWKKSCTTKIPLRTPQVVQVFFHQLYSICYTKKTCQLSIHVYIYIYILFKQDSSWLFDLLRQQKTWRWLPEGSQNSFAMYTEQVYPNCCSKVPLSTQSQDEGIVPYARPPLDGYYVLFCICTCICLQLEGKSQYSPYSANKGQHPRWWKKIHGPRRRFKNPVVGSTFISALGPWPPKNTDPMWVILVTCDMFLPTKSTLWEGIDQETITCEIWISSFPTKETSYQVRVAWASPQNKSRKWYRGSTVGRFWDQSRHRTTAIKICGRGQVFNKRGSNLKVWTHKMHEN